MDAAILCVQGQPGYVALPGLAFRLALLGHVDSMHMLQAFYAFAGAWGCELSHDLSIVVILTVCCHLQVLPTS